MENQNINIKKKVSNNITITKILSNMNALVPNKQDKGIEGQIEVYKREQYKEKKVYKVLYLQKLQGLKIILYNCASCVRTIS